MAAAEAAELIEAGLAALPGHTGSADRGDLAGHARRRKRLGMLAARAAPAAAAHERTLPLLDAVAPLFPGGVLRRGSTVSITGSGATGLALAVAAGPSAQGSWLGVVADPELGWAAAEETGIDLARVLAVDPAPSEWAYAVAALIGSVDLILVAASRPIAATDARRLAARARERDSVLICRGSGWPQAADVQIEATACGWQGIGDGHGMLCSRRVQLTAGGRGAASRPRRAELLLPGPQGAPVSMDSSAPALGSVAVSERGKPGGARAAAWAGD